MANDSKLFRTAEQLSDKGFNLSEGIYQKQDSLMLPLYEAKMLQQYNHRFSTYKGVEETSKFTTKAQTKYLDRENNDEAPLPRYWIDSSEILKRTDGHNWMFGWRDITNVTSNRRTLISTVVPMYGYGDKFLLMKVNKHRDISSCLLQCFNSFIVDFVVRRKFGGTSLKYHYMRQFPILPPSVFTPTRLSFITPRVLELTYTAHDLSDFAADLGYTGGPFTWNDERRFWLRAELDALYFILYGIAREDVAYIMDTFPIVRRKDEAAHGGVYRTKEAILSVFDELQALGLERLDDYQSKVQGGNVAGGWTP